MLPAKALCERMNGREASKIERSDLDRRVFGGGPDIGRGRVSLLRVTAGEHDVRACARELPSRYEPQAAVGAGDDGGPAVLIGNLVGRPLRAHQITLSLACVDW